MQTTLESAISWILADPANIKAFRADIGVIQAQFPALTAADMDVLKSVQAQGLNAEYLEDSEFAEVEAQRSFGWSDHPTKR